MEVIDALDKSSFSEPNGERIQENQLRREMRKVESPFEEFGKESTWVLAGWHSGLERGVRWLV